MAQNGRDVAICTVPKMPRLKQGPCARGWGPRPASVGPTQAQRAEVVDIAWCPSGARTGTSWQTWAHCSPALWFCANCCPSLSLGFLSTSHRNHLIWHLHRCVAGSTSERWMSLSRTHSTQQCPLEPPGAGTEPTLGLAHPVLLPPVPLPFSSWPPMIQGSVHHSLQRPYLRPVRPGRVSTLPRRAHTL